MTLVHETAPDRSTVDLQRWPAMHAPRPAPFRATAARLLLRRVARLARIRVELPDGGGFGPADGPLLRVLDETMFTRLGRDAKVGFGESFMAGEWDSPELVEVLERLARHVATLVPTQLQWLRRLVDARFPAEEDNDRRGARRNIARHYDLSNELFAAFLDESMTYSSALYDDPIAGTLEDAQARKIERLLDVAGVRSGGTVLEIGTGWGELSLRAALRGATVTTVTLSAEQAALARERIDRAGCTDAVDIRVQDYRDTTGRYDS